MLVRFQGRPFWKTGVLTAQHCKGLVEVQAGHLLNVEEPLELRLCEPGWRPRSRHGNAHLIRFLELLQLPSGGIVVVVAHLISFLEHLALAVRAMALQLEGLGILMDNPILFFTQPECTLLTAVAPKFFHILVGVSITFGVPATVTFSYGPWMVVVFDLIHDLIPWDQAVVDAHVEP